MSLIVQKYGGSSVADATRIKAVRDRIKATVAQGHQVVVVVSAMGKTTDTLVGLADAVVEKALDLQQKEQQHSLDQQSDPQARAREMDLLLSAGEQISIALLSMSLQSIGQPAIALTGAQVPIITEPHHTRARVLRIETGHVRECLDAGKVVIIAGFQGVAIATDGQQPTRQITTFGRGGSDTSAVAIAAAIGAEICEIYTDVPGILTTDPRIVPEARLLDQITCDEMLELASQGAKVLHPRAVEIARNFGVKMAVRSSWLEDPGTVVISPTLASGNYQALEVNRFVEGITSDRSQAKIAILGVPDCPGIAAQLFGALSGAGLNIDLIVQSIQEPANLNDIAFTVDRQELTQARTVVEHLELEHAAIVCDPAIAIVSIVGVGMIGRPGIAAQMFMALGKAGVNIQMISTSEIKISCVIAEHSYDQAIAALQDVFAVQEISSAIGLPIKASNSDASTQIPNQIPNQKPEQSPDAPVRGVALDLNRTRLAIKNVPDRPGVAASIFQCLADRSISVDTIIQSQPGQQYNDIAFTVPVADLNQAEAVLKNAAMELGYGEVVKDEAIAKVSIVGTGMIEQPGVAAQMFTAFAKAGINIEMIATSEIKVSCVVRQEDAIVALKTIHQAFNLAQES
ncbi:aspartate kinase [Thalassoporum mexicanum PCC 7367]|uniref:aspartate kinase n=1 Tax=Thalassoporum mexicanum TaxID=3457544 RepID=UPI00029F97F0|nr:aspartate kinase [Pseudanabaena sp. PCC 7367]AFY68825.1 aspartate kinase [Pseudanabaena sp. PCC 7367]